MSKTENGEAKIKQPMSKKKKLTIIIASVVAVVLVAVALGVGLGLTLIPGDKMYTTETVTAKSEKEVKVGIISDTQLPDIEGHRDGSFYQTVMNGGAHLIEALEYYKTQDVDMIVINGDLVNSATENAGYNAYNKILDFVYGKKRENMPHIIYPMGNHEFYGTNQEARYYHATGLPLNARTIVNGYSFISIANSNDGGYSQKRIDFLANELKKAESEHPNQPIFVFMHMPITDDINGGHWATPDAEQINDVLKNYPQAVVFTSHSHYCLADERAIVQRDYTQINTGTTSYFDLDWLSDKFMTENKLTTKELFDGKAMREGKDILKNMDYYIHPEVVGINKTHDIPYRNTTSAGMLLTINCEENSFTLDKVNFASRQKFGSSLEMDFGKDKQATLDKSTFKQNMFTRTLDQLKDASTKPVFDANAKITAESENGIIQVTFSNATNVMVKSYIYEIIPEGGTAKSDKNIYSRFFAENYILGKDTAMTEQHNIYHLEQGKQYTLNVYAVDSFGAVSTIPLTASFTA